MVYEWFVCRFVSSGVIHVSIFPIIKVIPEYPTTAVIFMVHVIHRGELIASCSTLHEYMYEL